MSICDITDLGAFDSCEPIDLSGYAPVQIKNHVTRFDCIFTVEEADSINLAPGRYYFEDEGEGYVFTMI